MFHHRQMMNTQRHRHNARSPSDGDQSNQDKHQTRLNRGTGYNGREYSKQCSLSPVDTRDCQTTALHRFRAVVEGKNPPRRDRWHFGQQHRGHLCAKWQLQNQQRADSDFDGRHMVYRILVYFQGSVYPKYFDQNGG